MLSSEPFILNVKVRNIFFPVEEETLFSSFKYQSAQAKPRFFGSLSSEEIKPSTQNKLHEVKRFIKLRSLSHMIRGLNYDPADSKGAVCSNQRHLVWI